MDELLDILNNLLKLCELPQDEGINEIDKLILIYSDPNFRHSYADLSQFCQEIMPDQREVLLSLMDDILKELDSRKNECLSQAIKGIGKLADHIDLEGIRLTRMDDLRRLGDNMKRQQIETKLLIEQNQADSSKIKNSIDNMNMQVISVLGVFSAIVVAFFGGFSYFTSIFDNLHELSIAKAAFFTALIGLVIFNMIVVLLLALSRLLERPLFSFKKEGRKKEGWRFTLVYVCISVLLLGVMVVSLIVHSNGYAPLSEADTNTSSSISVDVNLQQ